MNETIEALRRLSDIFWTLGTILGGIVALTGLALVVLAVKPMLTSSGWAVCSISQRVFIGATIMLGIAWLPIFFMDTNNWTTIRWSDNWTGIRTLLMFMPIVSSFLMNRIINWQPSQQRGEEK